MYDPGLCQKGWLIEVSGVLSPDKGSIQTAQVIFGARHDPAFGDTIKVMSIITGVANKRLGEELVSADQLGEALNIARKAVNQGNSGLQRFD